MEKHNTAQGRRVGLVSGARNNQLKMIWDFVAGVQSGGFDFCTLGWGNIELGEEEGSLGPSLEDLWFAMGFLSERMMN